MHIIMEQDIRFLQNNVATKSAYMVTCLEIGLELGTDFILFQEPYIRDSSTISHPSYNVILPETSLRPRVAIFHRKLSQFQFCQRNDLSSSDLLVIDILGSQIPDLQLINIYNEKSLEPDQNEWTVNRALINLVPSKNTILGGDFNAHHPWWNSSVDTPLRAGTLVNWLAKYRFDLLNQPDQPTFSRTGMTSTSVIDLVFTSIGLQNRYIEWEINQETASGSDHEILLYSILGDENLVENPTYQMLYNLEKADWKAFSEKLLQLDQNLEFQWKYIESQAEDNLDERLEAEALNLQRIIQIAADSSIPRKKASNRSKAWWSDKLRKLRRAFGRARKKWKQSPNQENHEIFCNSRNLYFQEIKIAKTSCWNSFLENAQGKEIFKAFSYTKRRQTPRLPILKYSSPDNPLGPEKYAITFPEKCHAFLTTLFQTPPSSDPIDWAAIPMDSKWEWPKVRDKEVKEAIFSSSIKKAPGPDGLSFLILQKAYMSLEIRFNRLYRILIRKGYHPRCWKMAKGVILRKSANQKRDFTKPKAYRVISLLNCLGKVSEKILAKRLADLADLPGSDLLYHDQMGGRPKRSAIDTVLSLVHDIQMAKNNKEIVSVLFIDVKGAFDHVSKNQMLRICTKLGLPLCLIRWISSFLSDRRIQLAFDADTSQETSIEVGIPQGSPISPILFLIYIRFLFDNSEEIGNQKEMLGKARYLSYMDDIGVRVSSRSLENNCRLLEIISKVLFQRGKANHIQFDPEKIELIHFHSKRSLDLENQGLWVKLEATRVKPQKTLKWLGIYLDSKLNFKEHVTQMTSKATRVFHQIERLSNTERGLSFQAMRQLYISCICSIADYGVPIWWAGQRHLVDKFQKLQNQALYKILGAFKKSPIRAMEIEASLPPPEIRFIKICRNYAYRSIFLEDQHVIKDRLPSTFFLNQGNTQVNTSRFLDWHTSIDSQRPQPRPRPISREDSEDPDYRPKNRTLKHATQLIRVLSLMAFRPWKGQFLRPMADRANKNIDLKDIVNISIPEKSKEEQTSVHKYMINQWTREALEIDDKIIIYSDGSQSEKGSNGVGIFLTNAKFSAQESFAWNLGTECEVFDAELFAIYKALEISSQRIKIETIDIWIFSDSQASLMRLKNNRGQLNQAIYEKIYLKAQQIREKAINIHIQWVPGHMGIYGNEKADKAAKYGAEWAELSPELGLSASFLKRKSRERTLEEWTSLWQENTQGHHYMQFKTSPRWKVNQTKLPKQLWSRIIQLKIGHGYFRSYLARFPDYDSDICNKCQTNQKQTPSHLLLQCPSQLEVRQKTIQQLAKGDQNLYSLFMTKKGQEQLISFLKESGIVSRKWILGQT
jgi:ribonuclease HI